jgi:hypothetical protein
MGLVRVFAAFVGPATREIAAVEANRLPSVLSSQVYWLIGHCLAAYAAIIASRFLSVAISAHVDSCDSGSEGLIRSLDRASDLLAIVGERLASAPAKPDSAATARGERKARLTAILETIRGWHWSDASAMLDEFALEFPDDPAHAALRSDLAAAKADFQARHQSELRAAQDANDADRVLELYRMLAPCLELIDRPAFDRELAGWFLTLIHRRLRGGTIQVDVVNLATQFAETFGTTVEGASVRAALPTLRRSAGLCPRCAQPYLGVADTCAQCRTNGQAG